MTPREAIETLLRYHDSISVANPCGGPHCKFLVAVDALRSAVEDHERLGWLEKSKAMHDAIQLPMVLTCEEASQWRIVFLRNMGKRTTVFGDTLRTALDAARTPGQGGGE